MGLSFYLADVGFKPGPGVDRPAAATEFEIEARLTIPRGIHYADRFSRAQPLSHDDVGAAQSGEQRMISAAVLHNQYFAVAPEGPAEDDLAVEGSHDLGIGQGFDLDALAGTAVRRCIAEAEDEDAVDRRRQADLLRGERLEVLGFLQAQGGDDRRLA